MSLLVVFSSHAFEGCQDDFARLGDAIVFENNRDYLDSIPKLLRCDIKSEIKYVKDVVNSAMIEGSDGAYFILDVVNENSKFYITLLHYGDVDLSAFMGTSLVIHVIEVPQEIWSGVSIRLGEVFAKTPEAHEWMIANKINSIPKYGEIKFILNDGTYDTVIYR